MTPREIAERHCNVVEGDGFYCLSVCGTLEPFANKANAEKARAGCLDELTAVIAAACEEAAAEARRAEREACARVALDSACVTDHDAAAEEANRIAAAIRARKEAE